MAATLKSPLIPFSELHRLPLHWHRVVCLILQSPLFLILHPPSHFLLVHPSRDANLWSSPAQPLITSFSMSSRDSHSNSIRHWKIIYIRRWKSRLKNTFLLIDKFAIDTIFALHALIWAFYVRFIIPIVFPTAKTVLGRVRTTRAIMLVIPAGDSVTGFCSYEIDNLGNAIIFRNYALYIEII